MSENVESIDILRAVAKNDDMVETLYKTNGSLLSRCLAAQLVDIVHFRNALDKLEKLIIVMDGENSNATDVLDEGALIIADNLWTWEEVLSGAPQNRFLLFERQ